MRLLLAEDELDLAKGSQAILKHHHYDVDHVADGEEALLYARSMEYDGLILDVMMPKKSGFDVLKILRSEGSQVPTLLLTAKNQIEDKVQGLDLGADDYLTKPFDMQELLARIRSMLRRPANLVENDLRCGDLTLYRQRASLAVGADELALNKREFQLMEMFMMNQQQVLSTDLIMERIWGLDSDAEINVVWVNVSSLRKKLQQLGSKVTIKASRGLGYQLEVAHD